MGQNSDFVRRENTSTILKDDCIFLTAMYPNGINRKIKIKKDDFIKALQLCQSSKNLV